MLILETVSFGDQGMTVCLHPLSGFLTPQEVEAALDHAVDALSEPEEQQGVVFSARGWPISRRVAGSQDGHGSDLTVVTVRRFGHDDYLRDLLPRTKTLDTFGTATLPVTTWACDQRTLDETALRERLSLTHEAAHILSLVPLTVDTPTVTAAQAAAMIRAQYEVLSP